MLKITTDSHTDHALTPAHRAFILSAFAERDGFFIATVTLPDDLPSLPCGLHGPLMGDAPVGEEDVTYVARGTRPYPSRMVARPSRPSRLLTIIAGPHNGEPCILYTAFGGPLTPKEPSDPTLTEAQRAESERVWSEHALAL